MTQTITHSILRAAGALCLAASALGAHAASYNTNLIVNGGAEQGTTGWTGYDGFSLFSSVDYGSNWVLPTQPGPVDRGTKLFVGGTGVATAAGYQVLDLSANATAIATGQVSYDLSGWLGGWTNQGDNAIFFVSFLDGSNTQLGTVQLGPVTPEDRNNVTGLFYRDVTGLVPAGTTQVRFDLAMNRLVSGDNDGYVDNLSFTISAVPEPETLVLMLAGLAAVGTVARRRNNSSNNRG